MNVLFIASGAVLTASLFFGGGARRDVVGDLLPIVLSCGLIALAYPIARLRLQEDRFLSILLAGVVLLVVLQFIPLPPSVWGALPGRRELIEMYAQSGVAAPWASLAIRQGEAARSALAILPGIAMLLAVIGLGSDARQKLVFIVIAAALINAPLGMLQVLGGADSPLYFFEVTNLGSAVGFFANRNHYAAMFFCTLPLTVAVFASKKELAGAPMWVIGGVCASIILLGLSISGSRSALILGGVAVMASVLYVARTQIGELLRGRYAWVTIGVSAVILLPVAFGVGLLTILQRFDVEDLAEDGRWTFARVTMDALRSYFPVGAGLGSFQQLYQIREPADAVISPIVNHAHNDWLEIGLEMGLPAWALAAGFMLWLGKSLYSQVGGDSLDSRLARAGLLAIALLAIHSIWDYPLRTIALMALFGLCCGLTFRPSEETAAESGYSRRRRRGRHSRKRRDSATEAETVA